MEKLEKKKEKAEETLKDKKKETGKLQRDLAKIEQDIREVEVEITKKRPTFIKAKERVAHMQKKVESARKSLAQARIADEAHKKDINELQEELRQVEETKAAYEASIAGQSQMQGRDVQLEDEQVKINLQIRYSLFRNCQISAVKFFRICSFYYFAGARIQSFERRSSEAIGQIYADARFHKSRTKIRSGQTRQRGQKENGD